MRTIGKLASATPAQLKGTSVRRLLVIQAQDLGMQHHQNSRERYDPAIAIRRSLDEFDAAYWLLVNRMAFRDLEIDKRKKFLVFRYELASAVAKSNR